MPQEVIVSASLKVGGPPMIGTVKHFLGRREHLAPAPITLLSATQLRIGDNDVRQIICAVTESGQTSYLVNTPASPRAAASGRRIEVTSRSSALARLSCASASHAASAAAVTLLTK